MAANTGGALTRRGGWAYSEGGLTPLVGDRLRISGRIEINTEAIGKVIDDAVFSPARSWVIRQVYGFGR